MNKNNFLMTLLSVLFTWCLVSCNGINDPNNPTKHVYPETGMYLGITGFSSEVSFYGSSERRFGILSDSWSYENFINDLSMGDATVLYYAVDNNLSYLEKCQFPDDISSVSIITFTDGLDQGSRALDKNDQEKS